MTFLEAVNRILRIEGIIRGDDDAISAFSDTQHAANIEFAKLAVQDELSHVTGYEFVPKEEANGTITTVSGTRVYTLSADFVQFADFSPFLVEEDGSGNAQTNRVFEYRGGERQLRRDFPQYRENGGTPSWWYFSHGDFKGVGLYPVPSSAETYRYYYEKDTSVSVETDTVPFVSTEEANAFAQAAARRLKFYRLPEPTRSQMFPRGIDGDAVIEASRAKLMRLLAGKSPHPNYGRQYL